MSLSRAGFEVKICTRPEQLADLLSALSPAILILDVHLGDRNGIDLLDEMKTGGLLENTKAILLSTLAFPEVVAKATQAGAVDFLVKPFDAQVLIARVLKVARCVR
jgi:DNA-binding response OmpR family regulator